VIGRRGGWIGSNAGAGAPPRCAIPGHRGCGPGGAP
jgi:hypothetical protein